MYQFFCMIIVFVGVLYAQENLSIAPEVYHLNKIPDNKDTSLVFEVKNNGQQTITIEKVETSCGCSSATPEPSIIAKGESSQVKVTLDPRGKENFTSWQVKVFTNSLTHPILYASFDAEVLKTGTVSHKFISLGEFKPENIQEKKIWIAPEHFATANIISVSENIFDVDEQCFDIKIIDDIYDGFYPGPRKAKCIHIQTKGNIPYGRIDGEIVIKTNIPEYEEVRVPIVARVLGDIGIRPDIVSFGLLKESEVKERQVYIYHRQGESFNIEKIYSPLDGVKIDKEVMIPEQYYRINIAIDSIKNIPAGEIRSVLFIETSDAKQKIVKIPLQGYVIKNQEDK